MSKIKVILFSMIIVFGSTMSLRHGSAQEPPLLMDVKIRSEVRFDPQTETYAYSYAISNSPTSTGQIRSFGIDLVKPANSKDLSAAGFLIEKGLNFQGAMIRLSYIEEVARLGPLLERPLIPVGARVPSRWSSSISMQGTITWGAKEKAALIGPGQSLVGFEIISHGLPGMRVYEVKPDFVLSVEGFATKEDIEKSKAIKDQITFHGKTIGPTAPPAQFVALDLLSYLIDLKHQAQTLGWIGGPKFVAELEKKLNQVKEKLQANNIPSARGKLKSFINKVEAQFKETKEHEEEKVKSPAKGKEREEKKFITSEGYGLLKFNAMYLRDQLGSGEKPEEEKDTEKDE
ncbi:MAG: hypothetical protein ACREIQ_08265 [Nitrospiria bacterium]